MFNEESLVLAFEVDYSQTPPPLLLGLVHFFQATIGLLLSVILELLHK
jgi:hypothetical protein